MLVIGIIFRINIDDTIKSKTVSLMIVTISLGTLLIRIIIEMNIYYGINESKTVSESLLMIAMKV